MPNLKKYRETKLVRPELNVFLAVGVFDPFTGKKKKNNAKQPNEGKKIEETERKPTDSHLDMEKKVDALIENIGEETKSEEQISTSQKKFEDDSKDITEAREHFRKEPETSNFKTEIKPENDFDSFDVKDELFEMKSPSKLQSESKIIKSSEEPKKDILNSKTVDRNHTNDKNILAQTSGEHDVAPKHSIISFTHHIKIRNKEEREKLKEVKEKSNSHDTTPLSKNLKFKVKKKKTGTDNIFTKTERKLEEIKINNEIKKSVEHNKNKLRKLELKKRKKEARNKEKELEIKRLEEEKKKKLELKKARKMAKDKGKNLLYSNQQNTPIDKILEQEWKKNKVKNEKNNSQTPEMDSLFTGKKEDFILDEDVKKILLMTDNLLGKLPEEVIDEFVKSKDFALYEKVINKYKIK